MSLLVFTVGAIVLTFGAYRFSLAVRQRWAHPPTTPVLFSTAVVVAMLLAVRVDVDAYEPAKDLMTFLLGPATVALAIPLYRNRAACTRELLAAVCGLVAGVAVTIALAIACAHAFRLGQVLEATLAVKSATTAIAIEVARIVHGAIAHGIGTAQAATESELSGAVAGVSLGIGAILTSAFAPLLLRIFGS